MAPLFYFQDTIMYGSKIGFNISESKKLHIKFCLESDCRIAVRTYIFTNIVVILNTRCST